MGRHLKSTVALFLLFLVGCATVAAPRNMHDQIAYGYATLSAALETSASLAERQRITKDEAVKILATADEARALLDAAKFAVGVGDATKADQQLQVAQALLIRLEAYLRSKEAK